MTVADPAMIRAARPFLERAAPRYTSYPAANHFQPLDVAAHGYWLSQIDPAERIGLYLHIPYCEEMCWFCGCNTKASRRHAPVASYVTALCAEIAQVARHTRRRPRLHSIHFGGGSPTRPECGEMSAIFAAIDAAFARDGVTEISIEIDPRRLTPEKARNYGALGFNRASLGVQEIDGVVMAAINRAQPLDTVHRAVDLLRREGIERIGFDIMYGLPHQDSTTLARLIEAIGALAPDRVACFSYAHLPRLKKHQRLIDAGALPGAEAKAAMYLQIADGLAEHGYEPVGMDHFALAHDGLALARKRGTLRRNFQGYSDLPNDLLVGVGASAISEFGQGITQNVTPSGQYRLEIEAGRLATARGWRFSHEDRMRKAVISGLMCEFAVDVGDLLSGHGYPRQYLDVEIATLKPFIESGLVTVKDRRLAFQSPLRMLIRPVAAAFDAYAAAAAVGGQRYSKVA